MDLEVRNGYSHDMSQFESHFMIGTLRVKPARLPVVIGDDFLPFKRHFAFLSTFIGKYFLYIHDQDRDSPSIFRLAVCNEYSI